jgi:hypothetical protein
VVLKVGDLESTTVAEVVDIISTVKQCSFERLHFLIGEFGLMIVNDDRKMITKHLVKENSYEPLQLTSNNNLEAEQFELSTWVLRRSKGFYENGDNTYYIEQPMGEIRPRLIQNIHTPESYCRVMATRCEFSAGYHEDSQACWKIIKLNGNN